MSDDEPKDASAGDSSQEPADSPAASDQPSDQSEEQPADAAQPVESDQPAEQSEEQPAQGDQPTDQAGDQAQEQTTEGDQPVDQTEGQPAERDQQVAEAEPQATDSDQPAMSGTADDAPGFAGGTPSPGGGGGAGPSGPGKTTKVQVIAKFMTNSANDPFKQGSITMNVFDGAKGNLLWKLGSMDQQKVTFQSAVLTSNIIKSAMFSGVTENSVKVELRVRMLEADHEVDPDIPQVNFGTAAKFEVPAKGILNVDVDVEVTEKEFTVQATDESTAGDAARRMLANIEEIHLSQVKSATNVGAGQFRVVFRIPTKRVLILHPQTLEVIY
jgi:hypothetical protein